MTEVNLKIIQMINENISMKDIAFNLGLSEKQLYVRIKQIINYGYQLYPNYVYNSDIYYKIIHGKYEPHNNFSITTAKKDQKFRFLAISDLHVGNIDSDLNLVKYVYEYAKKEGINYIFICGDNIEGDYTTDKKSICNMHDQIELLLNKYPYDSSIKNVMIFGNHDYYTLKNNGIDMSKTIKNARCDMIPIGYGQGNVNLKNDTLILFHRLSENSSPEASNNEKLVLSGHGHMMKTKLREQLWICVPTLSYVSNDKTKDVIPGFVDISIDFLKGKFDYIQAKHIVITPKLLVASESRCKIKNLTVNDI